MGPAAFWLLAAAGLRALLKKAAQCETPHPEHTCLGAGLLVSGALAVHLAEPHCTGVKPCASCGSSQTDAHTSQIGFFRQSA